MLERLAKEDLKKILEVTGHTLCLDDIDDVLRLNVLAKAVSNPGDEREWDLLGFPVFVANVALYPPTIGAIIWLQKYGLPWFQSDGFLNDLVIAYALAHAHEPEKMELLSSKEMTKAIVKKWGRHLRCSHKALGRALLRLLPEAADSEKQNDIEVSYGPVIALLCREYDGMPHDWLWNEPMGTLETCLKDWSNKIEAEYQAHRKSAGKGVKVSAPPVTPKIAAIEALRVFKMKLVEQWATK